MSNLRSVSWDSTTGYRGHDVHLVRGDGTATLSTANLSQFIVLSFDDKVERGNADLGDARAMSDQFLYVIIVTGRNDNADPPNPTAFVNMAFDQTRADIRALHSGQGKPSSPLTRPSRVRFVHFNFSDGPHDDTSPQGNIYVYDHSFPQNGKRQFPQVDDLVLRDQLRANHKNIWRPLNDTAFVKLPDQRHRLNLDAQVAGQLQLSRQAGREGVPAVCRLSPALAEGVVPAPHEPALRNQQGTSLAQ